MRIPVISAIVFRRRAELSAGSSFNLSKSIPNPRPIKTLLREGVK
jgi:hypothetical protein